MINSLQKTKKELFMEQINYTKTTKKYQHLKYEQRLNLEFYLTQLSPLIYF